MCASAEVVLPWTQLVSTLPYAVAKLVEAVGCQRRGDIRSNAMSPRLMYALAVGCQRRGDIRN